MKKYAPRWVALALSSSALAAQNIPMTTEAHPATTHAASRQLIENYLTVIGGKQAHISLHNVVATGTIKEASRVRQFELLETQDGKRRVNYSWNHLGRDYEEVFAFDGLVTWQQQIAPKKTPIKPYSGQAAIHFKSHRWLIQPMIMPLKAPFGFIYQGMAKVSGRQAYIVVGYDEKNERSWFYFDPEKFLLTRWGGIEAIAKISEYMDYRATKFSKINGVLLPKQIDLWAENSQFGTITFDQIRVNQGIDSQLFRGVPRPVRVLRQQTLPR